MDVRIEGLHEQTLKTLAKTNGQPTAASMMRLLIRDAAMEAGIWPLLTDEVPDPKEVTPQPITIQSSN